MSKPTSETIAAYREVYDAMPPGFWPQVERMGGWRLHMQRGGHRPMTEIILMQAMCDAYDRSRQEVRT